MPTDKPAPVECFSAEKALKPLKIFQRRTVDYVFERLYDEKNPIRRFLVADEVGLGKTMVARGVIARAIEHLWDDVKRIDILYICSNHAIAAQNINRLNVLGRRELALPTRMTLIPLQLRGQNGLDANKVNFISLTPGTTFDLRSFTGVMLERALLFYLLREVVSDPRGLHNMLQVMAGADSWDNTVKELTLEGVDKHIIERFREDVHTDSDLWEELERICAIFHHRRDSYPWETMAQPRNSLVARLRAKLSHACVDALEPDLIIMDEFQRFRDLLHGESNAAMLARELFDYRDRDGNRARTLLLSATPYRMLTLAGDEPEEGDHYEDFLETLRFLYGRDRGPEVADRLAREMREFRMHLQGLPRSHAAAVGTREAIERRLRKVMARTERVANTAERDSMMGEPPLAVSVEPPDLGQAAAMSDLARALDAPQIAEYWKSAPYLLNFMREYKLNKLLEAQAEAPSLALRDAIQAALPTMLSREAIDAYAPLEPANGRMRAMMDDMFGASLEQNLWIPASMPYYGETGYGEAEKGSPPTKALVFSSWSMVPDAIAALLSYEAERRMGLADENRRYFNQRPLRPLQFQRDRNTGRLGGLRALLLLYPSPALAEMGDPLAIFCERGETLSREAMRAAIADCLEPALDALKQALTPHEDAPVSASESTVPEWAAPAVIDDLLEKRSGAWLAAPDGLRALASEDRFHDHVAMLAETATKREFRDADDDLPELLVDLALGSPAVCALRALHRIVPELGWDDPHLLSAAAGVAWAFRTLFNQNDAVALLRQRADDIYWRRILAYSANHNLQAVLDEYAHFLVDAEGLGGHVPEERVAGVGNAMARALSVRPSQIDVDDPRMNGQALEIRKFQMRGRFAMRLGDYQDEEGAVSRVGSVRDAFNSPFRPFVLASTSVGQEGLDFHPYCYRVYHWNLPSNPVDLEQREGRVHRFKGHAVRLNLAENQAAAIRGSGEAPGDPWKQMFELARDGTSNETDLVPYWICEGSVKVERRVPMLPFSREVTRLGWLKRSLAVYRLAFGQPRQDDFLDYLQTLAASGIDVQDLDLLQIRLEPTVEGPNSKP